MELVPVPLVPTCAKKWVYKAVENFTPRGIGTVLEIFWRKVCLIEFIEKVIMASSKPLMRKKAMTATQKEKATAEAKYILTTGEVCACLCVCGCLGGVCGVFVA